MFPDTPNTISIRLMIDNRLLSPDDVAKMPMDRIEFLEWLVNLVKTSSRNNADVEERNAQWSLTAEDIVAKISNMEGDQMLSISIDIGKVETDDLAGMMQHVH